MTKTAPRRTVTMSRKKTYRGVVPHGDHPGFKSVSLTTRTH
ncbi:unnamed protein product [Ectocarpus sp. CCAP 1310/34]|nr:unnamed protein product [Ectocarpus sp. CCAP 1310/34]